MSHQPLIASLHSFAYYVPSKVITNEYLSNLLDVSPEWIFERSGVLERRYVEDNQSTSDIAMQCLNNMKDKYQTNFEDIDIIIAATLSSDYYFPGIAPIIQNKLGISKQIPCLDIRTQCASFPYILETAQAYVALGKYKKVLVVCADVQSKNLDFTPDGKNVTMLFGDGASAFIVEKNTENSEEQNSINGIIDTIIRADGSGVLSLYNPMPGTSHVGHIDFKNINSKDRYPNMDGRSVFKNAVTYFKEVTQEIMTRNNINIEEIDHFIFHQANLRIIETVAAQLKIDPKKIFNNIEKFGNTTSATVGICLAEATEKGIIKKGDLILTSAFGTGFMWGSSLFRI
ncbi:MAG: ketoacyl-ACP synthase III [Bdellovibrionota bacterium]